jgi:hypothetical protein
MLRVVRMLVFSNDSALYHQWWDGSWLGPSLTGWERRGGVSIDVSSTHAGGLVARKDFG